MSSVTTINRIPLRRIARDTRVEVVGHAQSYSYNARAIFSSLCLGLFVLYFFIPHTGILSTLPELGLLFVIGLPLCAFILSIASIRQIGRTHERGAYLSYVSLSITSVYFMTALAMPLVLLGTYLVYSYLL